MASRKTHSPARALRRLGFRQTLRGALIVGVLGGLMMGAQGAAYAAAYPDQHSRDMIVASLKSTPGLGFMAGEIENAGTPASYAIYKSIAVMTLITGVWGLMVTTRLLRGQEEDGQLEQIVSKRTTKLSASIHLLIGYGYSFLLAFAITWATIAALGLDPQVKLSASGAFYMAVATFIPAIFFAALGVLTSQLAVSRGRAMAYALVPLLVLYAIRGAANSIADWNWLKEWTPFGWADLLNAVLDPHPAWILPVVIFAVVFVSLGLFFARFRDLGTSILPESQTARSHFYLLGSAAALTIRQNLGSFFWWLLGTLAFTGMLAAIAETGTKILESSPAAAEVFSKLGNAHSDLVITFLSFGGLFTTIILLVMATIYMSGIRRNEAKGYLDNMLVQPVSRVSWLTWRLFTIIAMAIVIAFLAGWLTWQFTANQNITLDFWTVAGNMIALVGPVVLLLGIGTLLYGFLPRAATAVMYVIIVWTFVVDILRAIFSLNDTIEKTSLLHYVSFTLDKAPDWSNFAWLVSIGVVLAGIGIWQFTRRDIVNE